MPISTSRISGIANKLGSVTYTLDPASTDLLIEDIIETHGGASFAMTVYVNETAGLCSSHFNVTVPVTYTAVVGGFQYEYDSALGIADNNTPNWFVKLCENLNPLFIPSSYTGTQCKAVEFLEQIEDNRIISIVINNTIISS